MDLLSWVKKTSFFLWGVLGFTYFGFTFTVIYFLFFCFLCIMDTLYGYRLARKNLIVSSRSWDVGVERKALQGTLILGIMVLTGSLAHEVQNEAITMVLSLFVIAIITGFSFWQITSLIENMAISAHGKEKWFINLLLKLAWIWQEKIEEKVQKYLPNTTPKSPLESGSN